MKVGLFFVCGRNFIILPQKSVPSLLSFYKTCLKAMICCPLPSPYRATKAKKYRTAPSRLMKWKCLDSSNVTEMSRSLTHVMKRTTPRKTKMVFSPLFFGLDSKETYPRMNGKHPSFCMRRILLILTNDFMYGRFTSRCFVFLHVEGVHVEFVP